MTVLKGVVYIFAICLCCVLIKGQCNTAQIHQALTGCQTERLILSNTSEIVNDTNYTKLCKAFLNYIKCVEPRLTGCKSSSLRGITIVKKTYSKEPYHCMLNDTAEVKTEQSAITPRQTSSQHVQQVSILSLLAAIVLQYLVGLLQTGCRYE
ncbi:uncharacterized protein LOC115211634 [Octopus sinensis]|uniref:Uncharacterized protein LOC115211634 n=1 Tax=Octopus sinensis TaxID=2607531 RepID=A0A7E6EWK4_9MOLL|nr:uncharacterized protein LOC115211634 [Octopus sinensis]